MRVVVSYLDSVLPEQVGQLLDSSTPEQVGQRVEVPDVELVVQRAAEAHTNEVRGEQNQYNLWSFVKVWYKHQRILGTSLIYSDMFSQFIFDTLQQMLVLIMIICALNAQYVISVASCLQKQ